MGFFKKKIVLFFKYLHKSKRLKRLDDDIEKVEKDFNQADLRGDKIGMTRAEKRERRLRHIKIKTLEKSGKKGA